MRSENEMYNLILEVAKNDARIKAVYMNGSRTNENVPKDIFQDYDIVYVVEDTQSFIDNKDWIRIFGEILYMQYPDENPNYPSDKKNSYGYLMQFADGIRMDLTVQSVNYALQHIKEDKLCKILLDKENILPEIEAATDCQYWMKKPTKEQYLAACNEFWWCTNNIAKGLWREEIPYVQDMTNYCVRPQLTTMLDWKVGILTGWSVSTGKSSKYLYKWLPEEEWQMFLSTYFDGNVDNAWKSVLGMCKLFEDVAQFVGEKSGWEYNEKEGKAARSFMEYVHQLSKIVIRKYEEKDVVAMVSIWNEVVEEGIAFPQEEFLSKESGREFFAAQSYCGVAEKQETGEILGLYIMHPNNIGRCGHIANASYAVASASRGLHIGEKLVKDCIEQAHAAGFSVLQFNAVVASNIHARHLYERIGFKQLGTIPKGFRLKSGQYEDICPYYIEV